MIFTCVMLGATPIYLFLIARMFMTRKRGFAIADVFKRPSKVPPMIIEEAFFSKEKAVLDEIEHAKNASNQLESVVIIDSVQTFEYLHKSEFDFKTEPVYGQFQDSVYFHNSYTRGRYTTQGVSLTVNHSERFVILSSKKSACNDLFLTLVGQMKPISGKFSIDGISGEEICQSYSRLHGIVGFQPENNAVDDDLTVKQHLTIFAKLAGIPEHDREVTIKDMIRACQLLGTEDTTAEELTCGQLRKLTLGMALMGRPKLVILSSPLDGVDPQAKLKLIETIISYTEGRALLLSTTNHMVAERIGNRVAIMENGKLSRIGTVKEILSTHGFAYCMQIQGDSQKLMD